MSGSAVLRLLAPFGMKPAIAYDPFLSEAQAKADLQPTTQKERRRGITAGTRGHGPPAAPSAAGPPPAAKV